MLDNIRRKFSYSNVKVSYNKTHNLCRFEDLIYYRGVMCSISIKRCTKKARNKSFESFHKTKNLNLNGVHMKMIVCPCGPFQMGHPDHGLFKNRQWPEIIERPFLLGETEVTQELYQAVMGTNPSGFQNRPQTIQQKVLGIKHTIFENTPQKPVECVTWEDAILFCNELSRLQGLELCYTKYSDKQYHWDCDFDKNGYRLPRAKEWEYAAKAGTQNRWAGTDNEFDDDEDSLEKYAVTIYNCKIFDSSNGEQQTHPVKSKLPNEWGFYDMSGNVEEWCWDKYDPYNPDTSAARIRRGGSWNSHNASGLGSADVNYSPPGIADSATGFRVCRSIVN